MAYIKTSLSCSIQAQELVRMATDSTAAGEYSGALGQQYSIAYRIGDFHRYLDLQGCWKSKQIMSNYSSSL